MTHDRLEGTIAPMRGRSAPHLRGLFGALARANRRSSARWVVQLALFSPLSLLGSCAPIDNPVPFDRPQTHFENVRVSPAGAGSVTSSPPGMQCPGECRASWDIFVPELIAKSNPGYRFDHWFEGGPCHRSPQLRCKTDVRSDNGQVEAVFVAVPGTLNVNIAPEGGGSVTSRPAGISCPGDCSEPYRYSTGVVLTAVASAGYRFDGWSGDCTGSGSCSLTIQTGKSVTATFSHLPVTLTVTPAPAGSGSVTSDPAGISCPTVCSAPFAFDTVVKLIAAPSAGYRFDAWGGACTGTDTAGDLCALKMNAEKSVSAAFSSTSPQPPPHPTPP